MKLPLLQNFVVEQGFTESDFGSRSTLRNRGFTATEEDANFSGADAGRLTRRLLARSFAADVRANREAKRQWRQAAEVLREGDHYILIMLDKAVGGPLKRWWEFWR